MTHEVDGKAVVICKPTPTECKEKKIVTEMLFFHILRTKQSLYPLPPPLPCTTILPKNCT